MLRSLFLALLLSAFSTTLLFAQKYSNEFLSIPVGARAQAMGGAQVGFVQDVTAGVWNPAGLTGVTADMQVAAMHNEWFASIGQYDYIGVAAPFWTAVTIWVLLSFVLGLIKFPIHSPCMRKMVPLIMRM